MRPNNTASQRSSSTRRNGVMIVVDPVQTQKNEETVTASQSTGCPANREKSGKCQGITYWSWTIALVDFQQFYLQLLLLVIVHTLFKCDIFLLFSNSMEWFVYFHVFFTYLYRQPSHHLRCRLLVFVVPALKTKSTQIEYLKLLMHGS